MIESVSMLWHGKRLHCLHVYIRVDGVRVDTPFCIVKKSKDLYTIQHQHRFVSCTCHSEYGHQRKSFAAGPASGIGVSLGRVLNTESTNQIGFRGMSDSLCASSYNIRTKEWTRRLTLLSSLTILQYQRW